MMNHRGTMTQKKQLRKIKTLGYSFLMLIFLFTNATAQIPDTDIFVADMKSENGNYSFSNIQNVTQRKGYDNQPYLDAYGYMYYVTAPEDKQTDVYRYNFITRTSRSITITPESEYSPSLAPGRPGKISVVRVDKDSAQRLYLTMLNRDYPELLVKKQDSVGYYCWINDTVIAMFILNGKTNSLQVAELASGKVKTVAENIGRCLQRVPDTQDLTFVDKSDSLNWIIKKYEHTSGKISVVCSMLKGSEDYAWTRDKFLLSGNEGKLYLNTLKEEKVWKVIADFKSTIGNFYRLALSPQNDRIAFVAYIGKKP